MNNYKITTEYEGTNFHGWQKQSNLITIQGAIEDSVKKFSNENIELIGCGRTDSGVHGLNHVANFILKKNYELTEIIGAINYYLKPLPIIIKNAELVNNNFNSRFDAKERSYIYKILNNEAGTAIYRNLFWHIKKPLNVEKMHEAAQVLVGKHDFTSFRHVGCQAASAIKTVNKIDVINKNDIIEIHISAPSFLYRMVRNITGALVEIGKEKINKHDLKQNLADKKINKLAMTAPAHGLYFNEAKY